MPSPRHTSLGLWTGRSTFFWAGTAATVGLGNLWQFPWLASQHGGGYFVLLYLFFLLVITLPLMMAESALGRYSRHSMVLAMAGEVRAHYQSPRWVWIGRASVLSGFLVLSITLVIGSVCLAYVFFGALGRFHGAAPADLAALLRGLVENPYEYRHFMAWHGLMVGLVAAVALRRGRSGIERAVRVAVPLFILMLGGLLWWLWQRPAVAESAALLLVPDRTGLSWHGVWQALSHAFYTLGLGLGVWAVLGAMMAPGTPMKRSILGVAVADTLIGVLAGVVIFSLVLSAGGTPGNGFGLVFVALPAGLAEEPYGQVVATAIFAAITLVAWTSALVLTESVTGWLREWTGAQRQWSVMLVLVAAWGVGLLTLFSFNIWRDATLAGLTPFRWIELLTSGILIPFVSVGLAIFLGWLMPASHLDRLLGSTLKTLLTLWRLALRWVLPVVVAVVGVNYTVNAFQYLCENGDLTWCAPFEEHGEPESSEGGVTGGDADEDAVSPASGGESGDQAQDEADGDSEPEPAPEVPAGQSAQADGTSPGRIPARNPLS